MKKKQRDATGGRPITRARYNRGRARQIEEYVIATMSSNNTNRGSGVLNDIAPATGPIDLADRLLLGPQPQLMSQPQVIPQPALQPEVIQLPQPQYPTTNNNNIGSNSLTPYYAQSIQTPVPVVGGYIIDSSYVYQLQVNYHHALLINERQANNIERLLNQQNQMREHACELWSEINRLREKVKTLNIELDKSKNRGEYDKAVLQKEIDQLYKENYELKQGLKDKNETIARLQLINSLVMTENQNIQLNNLNHFSSSEYFDTPDVNVTSEPEKGDTLTFLSQLLNPLVISENLSSEQDDESVEPQAISPSPFFPSNENNTRRPNKVQLRLPGSEPSSQHASYDEIPGLPLHINDYGL